MSGRVLMWCQHLLGTGHLRRALTLASAMAARGLDVTLASGGRPTPWLPARRVRSVQLPPVHVADAEFAGLLDAGGAPADAHLFAVRAERLATLADEVQPDVVITEMFPFGRRAFAAELEPWLERLRARRPRPWVVSSVRDVLVAPSRPDRLAEMLARVRRLYDRVLVHSDPAVIAFEASFPPAAELGERLRYTGFVVDTDMPRTPVAPSGEVLVSAGGGAVGARLLHAAIAARALTSLGDAPWRLIAGGHLPDAEFRDLAQRCPPGVVLERQRADFLDLLAACRLSVSQAGYNTVVELLALGPPAVLVPFAQGRETEQTTRALCLERLGRVAVVAEAELTPERLADEVDRAAGSAPAAFVADLKGAATSAAIVADLCRGPPP